MTPKILLVDDDPVFRSQFTTYLEAEFFPVTVAEHGEAALGMLDSVQPDIVLLDVRMPLRDGLDVCRAIRQHAGYEIGRRGIIMISGYRKEVVDKVAGLEIGADMYMIKPFEPRELLVQIKALWRLMQADKSQTGWFQVDENFRIHFEERIVEIGREEVKLTKLEFDVLTYLAKHANQPRSRSDLAKDVWQYEEMDDSPINRCISVLRRKIEPDPDKPRYIQPVYGVGYKLMVRSSSWD